MTAVKLRYFNMSIGDWLNGARCLTAEERGCYITIVVMIYDKGGPIPDDDRYMAVACAMTLRPWKRVKQALIDKGKIAIIDGEIHQTRCAKELKKAGDRIAQKAAAGAKGGRASAKVSEESQANVSEVTNVTNITHTNTCQKSDGEVSNIRDIDEARAKQMLSGCLSITKNQEPTPNKKEEAYAFVGNVIRLTQRDYDQWQKAYSSLDLRAELQGLDDWYSRKLSPTEQREWFVRCSKALQKRHLETKPPVLDPDEPGPHNNYFLFGRGDRTPKYPL